MDKIINKSQAIQGTVWVFIVIIAVVLWPLRLVQETVVSGSNRQISMTSEAITTDYTVMQMFVAQYDKLENIKVYLLNESAGEEFNFVLYDASMKMLRQQIVSTDDMEDMPGFCTIQINLDAEVGREYYYLLQGISTDIYAAYEDTETSGTIYNGTLFYANVEDTEHNIISEYEYRVPLRKGKTLVADLVLVLFDMFFSFVTNLYFGKYPARNTLTTVEKTFRTVANPIVIILGIGAMVAIWPAKLFTEIPSSILFYESGVLCFLFILLYGINHTRPFKRRDLGWAVVQDRWKDWLQAAMFAGAINACCHYMNGLYDVHHTLAYREMLIYFGLAMICTFYVKDLFHPVNLVYLPIAAIAGYCYYRQQLELIGGEYEIQALKWGVWAAVIAGIVVLYVIRKLIERRLAKPSPVYSVLIGCFFVLLIVFKNTRGWPIYLVCAFTVYYLCIGVWDRKERILNNICNGILFHFLAMVVYCLWHRPYMYFIYYRYPFIFHTVTMTAVYLTLVTGAAMVKLINAYKRCPKLAGVWKELAVFGMAAVYLLFTLSRTGYLAAIVMAPIILIICCFTMPHKGRALGGVIAMMVFSFVVCFPAVFTAQRIIPSVTADPILHEIEEIPEEVEHGRVMDSVYYITIQRFIQVFQLKILGMPEDKCINAFNYVKNDIIPYGGQNMLLASVEGNISVSVPEEEEESAMTSYANGRMDIFKQYYIRLNMTGHDDMGITLPDGSYLGHAHNIYLQTAYDHGIPVGIVFILVGLGTLIQGIRFFYRRKEKRACGILPVAILLIFAAAGLTEWIFHPCNPTAYALLLTLAPLLFDMQKSSEGNG